MPTGAIEPVAAPIVFLSVHNIHVDYLTTHPFGMIS